MGYGPLRRYEKACTILFGRSTLEAPCFRHPIRRLPHFVEKGGAPPSPEPFQTFTSRPPAPPFIAWPPYASAPFPPFLPEVARPMRMLSLAVFAVLALVIAAYEENGVSD